MVCRLLFCDMICRNCYFSFIVEDGDGVGVVIVDIVSCFGCVGSDCIRV